ncbi:MAG: SpoIIE family protein phosphatase [Chloroflexi bacterium]|nr:SpoIIE family protein phosphatase [Chloroflexota bacterium]
MFYEGDAGQHFYIVRDGELQVVKSIGTHDERIVNTRKPGEFIGEMSLFNLDGKRTASVRAHGDTCLWEMTRAEFDALLTRQPFLAYEMVRVLSNRLTDAHNNAMADLIAKNRALEQKNIELARAYEELQAAQAQVIEKEKLERELQLAAEIQMSILPRALPALAGYRFGAQIVPARQVGGDLYDFIPLSDDALAIVIGDVSDKGVPAAIFMAQTHALIRAEARQNRSPRETLERVNQYLLEMNAAGLFVTVLYGILNRVTREFQYARAGHELPLLRQPDGVLCSPPQGQGAPLGILDFVLLDEESFALPPGTTMLLMTDGVTEALNPAHEQFGSDRVQAALQADRDSDAQGLCNHLLEHIAQFRGSAPVYDDVALVAVQAE